MNRITESQSGAAQIKEGGDLFSRIFHMSPYATAVTRADDGIIQHVNEAFENLIGYSSHEITGKTLLQLDFRLHPYDWPHIMKKFEKIGEIRDFETEIRKKDGTMVSALISMRGTEAGNMPYNLFFIHESPSHTESLKTINDELRKEIAELKIIEKTSQENEARYHAMIKAFDGLIYVCSKDYRIEFMNQQLIERTGYDATGELCYNALHERDSVCPWCVNERVFKGETVRWEVLSPRDNRWYYVVNTPIFHPDGTVSKQAMILDITERKHAEEALRASEEKFSKVFRYCADVIGVINFKNKRFVEINEAFTRILGYSREEVIGHTSDEFGLWCNHEDRIKANEIMVGKGFFRDLETAWRSKSGETHVGLCSTELVEIGADRCIVFAWHDITERKKTDEALRQAHAMLELKVAERTSELSVAKEKAEAGNKAKSTFLANMSHELRTPLNAILGYSQLMQIDKSLQPDHVEYLNIINHSGEHLLTLINEVLELSKIEAKGASLQPAVFDLHALLSDVQAMFWVRTEARGLRFSFSGTDKIPRYVVTDENKLRQILINLVGNAVKFTEKGCIAIRATAVKEMRDETHLVVEVEDTGFGIAEDELDKLFKYFEQTTSGRQIQGGTGLGLAISREYARLMGGDITVTSRIGVGSVFRLEISIKEKIKADLRVKARQRHVSRLELESGQSIPRILIAEDSFESRSLLVRLVERVGFETQEAKNGLEAVKMFEKWRPHLIWMDIRMPVMNGLDAARFIKSTDAGRSVSIVALTASVMEEDRESIMAAGCDDFVRKPYYEHEIFETMAKHLDLKYVYEYPEIEKEQAEACSGADQETLMASLPDDLRAELHEAVLRLNTAMIFDMIDKIDAMDPSIGSALRIMAENMEFDRLLNMLEDNA